MTPHRIPIRWLIPLLVVFFGLLSNLVSYLVANESTHNIVIKGRQDRLIADLVGYQLDLEGATNDEIVYFQRDIGGLSQYPSVKLALLINSVDRVVASTRLGLVGRIYDPASTGLSLEQLQRVQSSPAPSVWLDDDETELTGVIRICRVVSIEGEPATRCGVLLIREDLTVRFKELDAALFQQLLSSMLGTIALSLVIVALLYWSVVRRLEEIVSTATQFGRGVSSVRVPAVGDDEIASIGRAINLMLDRVSTTQRRLRNRQAHLSALFDDNAEGLVVINKQGIITEFNRAAEKIFGYNADQVVGDNVKVLMSAQHAAHHDTTLDRYVTTGHGRVIGKAPLVTEGRHRDGSSIPLKIGVSEVRSGEEVAFIGTITDLTEMRRLEEQAQRAQKMEAVGALTGGIAHDFNNLLGIIIGNLDMLRRQVADDPKVLKRVEKAIKAATRGSALTGKLLNFSRQRPERVEPVALSEVVTGIEELLDHSLTSRIGLHVAVSDDLPPMLVDPSSMQDALVNLVLNARDAMPEGGDIEISARPRTLSGVIPGKITLGVDHGEFIEVCVRDQGSGIEDAVLQRIFEPFFTTKATGKGTGLGLAMVYGFIRRSSGALSVTSEIGKGSSFCLYLPVADMKMPAMAREASQTEVPQAREGERILVVEDESELRELAVGELCDLGYSVVEATDAQQAMDILAADSRFDLVFSDIVMPGSVDGLALAETVHERFPQIAVLLTSGFTGRLSQSGESLQRWSSRILDKPYSLEQLASRVRGALDAHAEQRSPSASGTAD
jgi:PAS domain S-box-containing protein